MIFVSINYRKSWKIEPTRRQKKIHIPEQPSCFASLHCWLKLFVEFSSSYSISFDWSIGVAFWTSSIAMGSEICLVAIRKWIAEIITEFTYKCWPDCAPSESALEHQLISDEHQFENQILFKITFFISKIYFYTIDTILLVICSEDWIFGVNIYITVDHIIWITITRNKEKHKSTVR